MRWRQVALEPVYFMVQGEGAFPVELLAVERAWPVTARDADALVGHGHVAANGLVQVELATVRPSCGAIQIGAWAQAGWPVVVRSTQPLDIWRNRD